MKRSFVCVGYFGIITYGGVCMELSSDRGTEKCINLVLCFYQNKSYVLFSSNIKLQGSKRTDFSQTRKWDILPSKTVQNQNHSPGFLFYFECLIRANF